MVVVLFTIFVLGGSTPALLRRLRMPIGVASYNESAMRLTAAEHHAVRRIAAIDRCVRDWIVDPIVAARDADDSKTSGVDSSMKVVAAATPRPVRLMPQSLQLSHRCPDSEAERAVPTSSSQLAGRGADDKQALLAA
eukprot:6457333-Prymnesium_polylepis.1